jgi:hypothetical protein
MSKRFIFLIFALCISTALMAVAKDGRLKGNGLDERLGLKFIAKPGGNDTKTVKLETEDEDDTYTVSYEGPFSQVNQPFEVIGLDGGKILRQYSPVNFDIVFKPQKPGLYRDSIIIRISGEDDSLVIMLTADVQEPRIAFFKTGIPGKIENFDFQNTKPGVERKERFQLKNIGQFPEGIAVFKIEQPQLSKSFELIADQPPFPLPNGGMKEFSVRFFDTIPGDYNARVIVVTNSGDTARLALRARILPPERLLRRPEIINFQTVKLTQIYTDSVKIINRNLIAAKISELRISDNDTRFQITSPKTLPGGKFLIEPNDSATIIVKFNVAHATPLSNDLSVRFHAFDGDYEVPIKAVIENTQSSGLMFTFSPSNDFGEIDTGTVGTSQVTITNDGNDPVTLSKFGFKNYQGIFKTDISTAEIQIPPYQERTFIISFKPTDSIEYKDIFEAFDGKKTVSFSVVGKGRIPVAPTYSTTLTLENLTVPVGEQFILPVRLTDNKPDFPVNTRKNFRIELRFTASVLYYPAADNGSLPIEYGERIIAVTSNYDSGNSVNELIRLTFKTALGDMPFGHIRITDFTWLDDAGNKITTNATFDTAVITITGTEGQLVNSNKKQLTLSVSPNPAIGGDLVFEFANYQPGAALKIYNTQGVLVRDLSGEIDSTATSFKITCPTAEIPEGAYFCRLTSGNNSIVRTIFVQK